MTVVVVVNSRVMLSYMLAMGEGVHGRHVNGCGHANDRACPTRSAELVIHTQ